MDHRRLVQYVKETQLLWDRTQSNFRDKECKERAWAEIAAKLNVSAEICKDTFKGLREKYVREREKATNIVDPRKEWSLLQDLTFLDPHILTRNSSNRNMDELSSRLLQDDVEPEEFDKKLIELVKNSTPIWDRRSSNVYPSRALKNQLWRSIAVALNKDVDSCILRWKALREKYIRQKAKFQEGEPKWELLDALSFLDNVIQYRRKENHSLRYDVGERQDQFFSDHRSPFHQDNEKFEYVYDDTSYYDSSSDCHIHVKQEHPQPDSSFMGESSCQKRPRTESMNSEQCSQKTFKSGNDAENSKSAEQLFGDLVASLLSRKPEKDRSLYMVEIMQVLSK